MMIKAGLTFSRNVFLMAFMYHVVHIHIMCRTVREVQEMLVTKRLSNEYLPIDGLKELKPVRTHQYELRWQAIGSVKKTIGRMYSIAFTWYSHCYSFAKNLFSPLKVKPTRKNASLAYR